MASNRRVGALGERVAEAFLELRGYRIICRNYRYAGREIDLLVRKGHVLIGVEVKLRRSDRYGKAVEAIDARKLGRIQCALGGALAGMGEPLEPRVDVVVIDVDEHTGRMVVRHIEAVY